MRKRGAIVLAVPVVLCSVLVWYYYGPIGTPPPETLDVSSWQEAEELPVSQQVSLSTRIRNYPSGTESVTGVWVNNTSGMLTIGAPFNLHKYIDGRWLVAEGEYGSSINFEMWGKYVYPGGANTVDYDLTRYVDEVTPGRYRISATASEEEWWKKHQVYAEFNIR